LVAAATAIEIKKKTEDVDKRWILQWPVAGAYNGLFNTDEISSNNFLQMDAVS